MRKVKIYHPETDNQWEVATKSFHAWEKKGWVLAEDAEHSPDPEEEFIQVIDDEDVQDEED